MLAAGKADAFASDDILLSGFIATRPDGSASASSATICPTSRMRSRCAATTLRSPISSSGFVRMATEGTLGRLYTRWLVDRLPNGETLGVPMSPYLSEMYRALGQPD